MSLGQRQRVPFPASYNDFQLIRTHGRVFAIPPSLDADKILQTGMLFKHPAVLSAPNLEEIRERVNQFDVNLLKTQVVGDYEGYNLLVHRDGLYALPGNAPAVDLDVPEDRRRAGVLFAPTRAELEQKIREAQAAMPIEFAGWLPIFEFSGNCGSHPQFTHTGEPPLGYNFTSSGPARPIQRRTWWTKTVETASELPGKAWNGLNALLRIPLAYLRPCRGVSLRARIRIFLVMLRLLLGLLWTGCKLLPTLRFMQSRHLQSQLLMGNPRELVFLTSMPYTYGQNPWVIEIEDPTTLFYPLIQNGNTCSLSLADSPYFKIVKTLLEADHCRGIITHMRSTAKLVGNLFQSDIIRNKIRYAPLGVKLPARWQRHDEEPEDELIHLLFINSWCQVPENFYVRGGLDILEAFDTLRVRYPQLRLTMRTSLPNLDAHYHRIMEQGWVRTFHRFISAEEMAELHSSSHIYLLPAARVHIVSLLQAMSYGLAVVASDGWGMEEYLTHERNGLIVKGRYGKVSWADEEAGMLREDYEPMYTADARVVDGIVEAVSRLVEDRLLRARLGRAARKDVETRFNMKEWNNGLKKAFDQARGLDLPESEQVRFVAGSSNGFFESLPNLEEAQSTAN